jgi:hypothetical protein
MTEYLRREKDRRDAILNDTPDTRFYFESQRFPDIPEHERPKINNLTQLHAFGATEVRKYDRLIEAAAERYSVDPDIVRAIIYTEATRGKLYGVPAEIAGGASTLYPGNISSSWQGLKPGSDVSNPNDNIELATMLISRIAKRLDNPSIENIYSLYNSLSHDRTYVNKETKSTPYFARLALEAKAWEKDRWQPPELPTGLRADRPDSFNGRLGNWASSPADAAPPLVPDSPNSFDDRFGAWGSVPAGQFGRPSSPVVRELLKYKRSALPDTPAVSTSAEDVPSRRGSFGRLSGSQVPSFASGDASSDPQPHPPSPEETVSKPARYLARRTVSQPETLLAPHRAPPSAEDNRPRGIFSGEPMPNYPVPPPIFGVSEPAASSDGTGFCNCLRLGKGDNESIARTSIAGMHDDFGNSEIGIDTSGKSVA